VKFALVLAAISLLAALVALRFMRRKPADTSDDASEQSSLRISKLSLRYSLGPGSDAKSDRSNFNPIAAVVAFSRQYHQEHSAERRSTVKIILALYQVLADLSNIFRVPFPPVYTETSSEFGLSNVDFFSIEQISCVTQLSYYTRVLLRTIIPLVLIVLLIVVGFASKGELLPKFGLFKNQKELGGSCLTFAFVIAFLVYPSLTSVAFKMFLCVELDDGTSWLREDMSLDCALRDHQVMMNYAIFVISWCTVGIPLFYAYIFFFLRREEFEDLQRREQVAEWESNLAASESNLAASDRQDNMKSRGTSARTLSRSRTLTGTVREVTARVTSQRKRGSIQRARSSSRPRKERFNRAHEEAKLPPYLQRLVGGYELRAYWFEIFECARKVALVGLSVFFEPASVAQFVYLALICFLSFGIYVAIAPYSHFSDDLLAQLCHSPFSSL